MQLLSIYLFLFFFHINIFSQKIYLPLAQLISCCLQILGRLRVAASRTGCGSSSHSSFLRVLGASTGRKPRLIVCPTSALQCELLQIYLSQSQVALSLLALQEALTFSLRASSADFWIASGGGLRSFTQQFLALMRLQKLESTDLRATPHHSKEGLVCNSFETGAFFFFLPLALITKPFLVMDCMVTQFFSSCSCTIIFFLRLRNVLVKKIWQPSQSKANLLNSTLYTVRSVDREIAVQLRRVPYTSRSGRSIPKHSPVTRLTRLTGFELFSLSLWRRTSPSAIKYISSCKSPFEYMCQFRVYLMARTSGMMSLMRGSSMPWNSGWVKKKLSLPSYFMNSESLMVLWNVSWLATSRNTSVLATTLAVVSSLGLSRLTSPKVSPLLRVLITSYSIDQVVIRGGLPGLITSSTILISPLTRIQKQSLRLCFSIIIELRSWCCTSSLETKQLQSVSLILRFRLQKYSILSFFSRTSLTKVIYSSVLVASAMILTNLAISRWLNSSTRNTLAISSEVGVQLYLVLSIQVVFLAQYAD